jgi:hypothetical protein
MRHWKIPATVLALLIATACSDNSDSHQADSKAANDHIWKEQTKALDKAKGVETMVMDAAQKRLKQSEQQTK